jgi:hypothetical protein
VGGSLFRCRGKERRRRNRGGEGQWPGHILTFTKGITDGILCHESINNSVDEVDMSLYGHPGLNPFVISSVKSLTKTSTSSHFFVF